MVFIVINNKKWFNNHRINENGITEKLCSTCQNWFEESINNFYYKNKKYPEKGFVSECKKCAGERTLNVYNRMTDDEKKTRRKLAYKQHKEKENKRSKKWRKKNKEHKQEYQKDYYKKHPEVVAVCNKRRRHKNHKISKQEWIDCKQYFYNSCAYCGMIEEEQRSMFNEDLHKEHVDSSR